MEEKQSLHIENSLAEHLDLASLEEESYLLCKEFIEKAKRIRSLA